MAVGIEKGTPIVNEVITNDPIYYLPPFDTSSPDKIREIAEEFGIPEEKLQVFATKVDEIQDEDPRKVVQAKAKAAYEVFGIPVIVEDTSLRINSLTHLFRPPFVKYWAETPTARAQICQLAQDSGNTDALVETHFTVFDGAEVHMRSGYTPGKIADKPRGSFGFGFDDMFIPNGQENLERWNGTLRTYAEMKAEEKAQLFARQEALKNIKEDPFALGTMVFAINALSDMESPINHEYFKGPEMALAREFAFGLRSLQGVEPNEDLWVDPQGFPPFHEEFLTPDGEVRRYTVDPNSADIGLLVTPVDTRTGYDGKGKRLVVNPDGRGTFLQRDSKAYQRALAARAYEFSLHHNTDMYNKLRSMMEPGYRTTQRTNERSPVIEKLLELLNQNPGQTILSEDDIRSEEIFSVPGFSNVSYVRQYSDAKDGLSRTTAAMNHIINRNGIPTSIFSLGGMPSVTGQRDTIVTAAASFMRSYISHNSLLANFDRRRRLFKESKEQIESLLPDKDIRDLAVAQIGVCISGKNIEKIGEQASQLIDDGCGSLRIYTTNPGIEVVNAAKEICMKASKKYNKEDHSNLPFHLCVGPIVDVKQAEELRKIAEEYGVSLTLLAGHGGGENCTSLEGGAAANAIEIVYDLARNEKFNNVSLGFEGGLGTLFGPWLAMVDQISKNGSIVKGTVEAKGGLCALHRSGAAVMDYHGSASSITGQIEQATSDGEIVRSDPSGSPQNVEGKPNYMEARTWAPSMVHFMKWFRTLYGRTLADQQSMSIDDLIKNIKDNGWGHRIASPAAFATAQPHRGE